MGCFESSMRAYLLDVQHQVAEGKWEQECIIGAGQHAHHKISPVLILPGPEAPEHAEGEQAQQATGDHQRQAGVLHHTQRLQGEDQIEAQHHILFLDDQPHNEHQDPLEQKVEPGETPGNPASQTDPECDSIQQQQPCECGNRPRGDGAVWNRTLDQSGWLDSLAFLLALLSAPGGPGAHYGAGRPGREYGAEPLSGPHLASAEYGAVHPLDAGGRQWLVGPVHPQHALEPLDLGVSGLGIFCGARVDRHRLYTLAPICPRLPGVVRPTGTRAYSNRSSPWPTSGSRCAHRSPDAPNGTPADGAGTA